MSGSTYFISDLHLEDNRPDISDAFFLFLRDSVENGSELYILGDWFEYWVGDDYATRITDEVAEVMAGLKSRNINIFFMAGNRDFLMGTDYLSRFNAHLIREPYAFAFRDTQIILMHGDTLCTADVAYQAFREQVRSQAFQADFLARPISERLTIAQQARKQSKAAYDNRDSDAIMDVTDEAVLEAFSTLDTCLILHGHTHRPNIHHYRLHNGDIAHRIVLGDWYSQCSYVQIKDDCLTLHANGNTLALD